MTEFTVDRDPNGPTQSGIVNVINILQYFNIPISGSSSAGGYVIYNICHTRTPQSQISLSFHITSKDRYLTEEGNNLSIVFTLAKTHSFASVRGAVSGFPGDGRLFSALPFLLLVAAAKELRSCQTHSLDQGREGGKK